MDNKIYNYWDNASDCVMMEIGRFGDLFFMVNYSYHHNQYSFSVTTWDDLTKNNYIPISDPGVFQNKNRELEAKIKQYLDESGILY